MQKDTISSQCKWTLVGIRVTFTIQNQSKFVTNLTAITKVNNGPELQIAQNELA